MQNQQKDKQQEQLPEKGEIYYLIRDKEFMKKFVLALCGLYLMMYYVPIADKAFLRWYNSDEIVYRDNLLRKTMQNITLAGTDKPLFEQLQRIEDKASYGFRVSRRSETAFQTHLTAVQVFNWYTKQLLDNGWEPIYKYDKVIEYAKDHTLQEQNNFINKVGIIEFFKQEHIFTLQFYDGTDTYLKKPEQGINCVYYIKILPTDKVKMPTPEHLK